MIWRVMLFLLCGAKYMVQGKLTLSPAFPIVSENTSLELTCNAPVGTNVTQWGTLNQPTFISYLTVSRDEVCETDGVLEDTKYFETECNSNGTFKVRIKQVNLSHDGQEWYCYNNDSTSNTVDISVQVPVKYVELANISGKVLNVIENISSTLTCCTSEGRPSASITWTKKSQTNITIDITHDAIYNVSTTEQFSEKNLIIMESSIRFVPMREDNNSNIICRAKNGDFKDVNKKVMLYVQYPPNKPRFFVKEEQSNGSVHLMLGSNVSILCKSDSNPSPEYYWNSTGRYKDGPYLNLSNLDKNETWQCTSANNMTLHDNTIIETSSAIIKIDLYFNLLHTGLNNNHVEVRLLYDRQLYIDIVFTEADLEGREPIPSIYPSEIDMFYVIGKDIRENVEATENETIVFNCSVNSIPKSEIVLKLGEKQLRRNEYTHTLNESLRITTCLDDGVYTCEAKNQHNSQPSSKDLRLSVKCTPLLSPYFNLTTNVTCPLSETITLHFKALANPTPQFYWLKLRDLKNLESSKKYTIDTVDNNSNLTIKDVTTNDYGIYKLTIQNEIGFLEQLYYLNPNEIPTLNGKPLVKWMYIAYICGGLILVLAALIITMRSRKRWLKQQSKRIIVYQNVSFGVPEVDSISTNLSYSTRTSVIGRHVLHTRKPEACKSKIRPQKSSVSTPLNQLELDLELDIEEPYTEASEYCNTMNIIERLDKIKVAELYDYVRSRTDESFNADFQKIPTGFQMPCCFARKPDSIALNRYKDILPYDHTRVCIDDQPDFFINASYIDGYNHPKAYIACLGPTVATHDHFKPFWTMVWHERSELIIMLTNLNEPSGMKCEQYWPDANQDEMYGDILVSCQKIEIFAEYTIRRFEVARTTKAGNVCRNVVHLHYTAWPDKTTPEDVTSLLEFQQKYFDKRTTVSGPVIVHCSAGIGRTGVFIAIDRLIMEGMNKGSVNVVACITKMREQRVRMVQTCEQYKFIFQALAYALNCSFEPIPMENFTDQFDSKMSDERLLDRQYKELHSSLEWESKDQTESREKNISFKDKNRLGADIPDNKHRVYLYLNRCYEDSDYINAVFINSYTCKDHFIMAQSPLPGTESDFLTLIYQENCGCVVTMEDLTEQEMKTAQYLPEEIQSLEVGGFTLSSVILDSMPEYTVIKVTIANKEKGQREFYHFQYKKWKAEYDTPESAEDFVKFVKDVKEYEKLGEDGSHVLVHCPKANERSGIFCAIAIMIEKLLIDEQVSVMNTLMHLRTRRRTAITSKEQVKFCYKAALAIARMHGKGTSNVSGTDRLQ